MNTIADAFEEETIETVERAAMAADEAAVPIITTLYDLMTALQAAVEPGEDDLVVATMRYMIRRGRITWFGDDVTLMRRSTRASAWSDQHEYVSRAVITNG